MASSPTIAAAPIKEGKTLENKQFREQFMLELSEMARTKWLEEDIHGMSSSMSSKLHSSSDSSFREASSTSSHQTNSVSSASSDVQEFDSNTAPDVPLVRSPNKAENQFSHANPKTAAVTCSYSKRAYASESRLPGKLNITTSYSPNDSGNRSLDFKKKCPLSSMVLPTTKGNMQSHLDIQTVPLSTQPKSQIASDPGTHQSPDNGDAEFRKKYALALILVPNSDVDPNSLVTAIS